MTPSSTLARLRAAGVAVALRSEGTIATRGTVPADLVPLLRDPHAKATVVASLEAELRSTLARAGDDASAIVDALAAADLPLRLAGDGSPIAAPGTPEFALKVLRRHRAEVLTELRRRGIRHWLGHVAGSAWRRLGEAVGADRAGELDDVLGDLIDNPAVADCHAVAEGLWSRVAVACANQQPGAAAETIRQAYAAAAARDLAVLRAIALEERP